MKFTHVTTSLLLAIAWMAAEPVRGATPATEMAKAANDFLGSLKPEQQTKASFDLKGDEHANWHFIPQARNGLPFKEMTTPQRNLAKKLLKSGLSKDGYGKATNIMSLELVLFDLENKSPKRDPELYYVSIFGKPERSESWGWRVEGHHLSINFTIAGGKEISATPSFLGSNPGEVKEGPRKGVRVLGNEEDLGRQLVKSFSEDQKKTVIFSKDAPKEVLTGNMRKVKPLEIAGLPQTQMTKDQTENLLKLIKEYLSRNRSEVAEVDLARIKKAGIDKIYFAWAGGVERGEPHYYRIQGPTFLMEYDNTQNDANHVHAVWRDFENDFGEDILKKHYEQSRHP